MRSSISRQLAPLAVVSWIAASPAAAAGSFEVIAQSFFAGATAVSADGSSAVTFVSGSSGQPSMSRWQNGVDTFVTNGDYISFGGLSADGSVVVGARDPIGGSSWEAFSWQNGVLTPLGPDLTYATDISADASTIVGSGSGGGYAYQGGIVTWLGDLPGGDSSTYALAVNGNGSVIAGQGTSASGSEAFIWQGGAMQGLGDLVGGGFESSANDISLDGSIIVGFGTGASGHEAVRWDNGVMTSLGLLDGTYQTRASGVSADGSIIVGEAITVPRSTDFASEKVAVFWDATGVHVLEDWLLQQFGLDLGTYDLRSAFGVSSDGRTIVGDGIDRSNGQRIGWVVVIPEPSTLPMLGLGAVLIGLVRRRR